MKVDANPVLPGLSRTLQQPVRFGSRETEEPFGDLPPEIRDQFYLEPNPFDNGPFKDRTIQELIDEVDFNPPGTVERKIEIATRYNSPDRYPELANITFDESMKLAETWFRSAAEQHDDPRAHYYLGNFLMGKPRHQTLWRKILEEFTGIRRSTPDEREGYKWLYLASKSSRRCREVLDAQKAMDDVRKNRRLSSRDIDQAILEARQWRESFLASQTMEQLYWTSRGKL